MSPRIDQVTAVIVTRGNTDLRPVLDSLIFDDVVIFNNALEPADMKTYGRVFALASGRNSVFYSQDDDIIHTAEDQARIVAEYQPGVLTGCMWPEWSDGALRQGIPNGYDDLVFPGSGSVYDRATIDTAVARYLAAYAKDNFFLLWCDTIVGILAPTRQLDIRFEALPEADADYRMANQPGFTEQKAEAIRRARELRKPDPHQVYLAEMAEGRVKEHRYL